MPVRHDIVRNWSDGVMLTTRGEANARTTDTCLVLPPFWERCPFSVVLSRVLSSEVVPFPVGALAAAPPTLAEDRVLTIVDVRPSHVNWNSRVRKRTNYHKTTIQTEQLFWKISPTLKTISAACLLISLTAQTGIKGKGARKTSAIE